MNFDKVISNGVNPSPELYNKILARIEFEENMMLAKKRVYLRSLYLCLSSVAVVFIGWNFYSDISQTGLISFASLLFTDYKAVSANLNDYSLLLLGAVPAASLSAGFLSLIVFISSLSGFSESLDKMKKIH